MTLSLCFNKREKLKFGLLLIFCASSCWVSLDFINSRDRYCTLGNIALKIIYFKTKVLFCFYQLKVKDWSNRSTLLNSDLGAFMCRFSMNSEILVACKTTGCEPLKIKSCILKFTSYLANVSGIDFFSFPVINFHFYFQTPKSDKVAHWIKCQKYELFFYNSIYFGYYRTSLSCVWLNANGCPYLFPIWP